MTWINLLPYLPQLIQGVFVTVALMCCSLLSGGILALVFTLLSVSGRWYALWPVKIYNFIIRGTPLLVQFFIIYYGLSQFDAVRDSILWAALQQPFVCAVLALALNTAAYTNVILRGAIRSVPHGEVEACYALGLSHWQSLRRVVLPRAFRIVLPAYSNEVVIVLKGTSLASTITLLDIMGVSQRLIAQTYAAIEILLVAGLFYFILNALLLLGFRQIERHYHAIFFR